MKRLIIVLILLILAGGGIAFWWFTRETPERLLAKSLNSVLLAAQDGCDVRLDVAATDFSTGITSGFAYVGQAAMTQEAKPVTMGVLRIAARTTEESDQTVDVVLDKDAVALRPRSVNQEWLSSYQKLSDDPAAESFVSIERDGFLRKVGYENAIAKGGFDEVWSAFSYAPTVVVPQDGIIRLEDSGMPSLNFSLDTDSLRPFLIDLVKAWTKADPTPEHYHWIDRVSQELSRGSFDLILDTANMRLLTVSGVWPILDEKGQRKIGNLSVKLVIDSREKIGEISLPQGAKDVSAKILESSSSLSPLPSAGVRTDIPTSSVRQQEQGAPPTKIQIDAFQRYAEELKKKTEY